MFLNRNKPYFSIFSTLIAPVIVEINLIYLIFSSTESAA